MQDALWVIAILVSFGLLAMLMRGLERLRLGAADE